MSTRQESPQRRRSVSTYLAFFVVLFFSNFFKINGLRVCRFHPSCSRYSLQAFERFNFFKAVGFTGLRLLKCHPFNPGGYDPLPNVADPTLAGATLAMTIQM